MLVAWSSETTGCGPEGTAPPLRRRIQRKDALMSMTQRSRSRILSIAAVLAVALVAPSGGSGRGAGHGS